jgi:predicted negative regulator of RcsB-dependent stress response
MTEEKKDDINEQQSFLSGHEELLNSINENKPETADEPEEAEPAEETPAVEATEDVVEEAPEEAKEEPVAEPTEEPAPVAEPEAEIPAPVEVPVAKEASAEEIKPEAKAEESTPEVEPEISAPTTTPEPIEEPAVAEEVKSPSQKPAQKPGAKKSGAKKKKKKKPQHNPVNDEAAAQRHQDLLKQQALEQQEVKEVLVFIKKYAKPAAIAVAIICAIVLADKFLKTQRHKKEAAADAALMLAKSPEDLQAIIDDYAATPAGPLAVMGLAREKFNAGLIDEAETLYTQFSKKHGDHELAVQAELNLISCKEAKGQPDVHLLYDEFVKKNTGSYLVPSAMLGKARCLEAIDQLDEAQMAYEDIMVNFPEESWSEIAEANLKVLLGKKQ